MNAMMQDLYKNCERLRLKIGEFIWEQKDMQIVL